MRTSLPLLAAALALLAACGAEPEEPVANRFDRTSSTIENKANALEAQVENEVSADEARMQNEIDALVNAAEAGNATANAAEAADDGR